jgi:trypsin
MVRSRALSGLVLCGLVSACAAEGDDQDTFGDLEQPIVRGQETDAYRAVVRVSVAGFGGGNTACTGSYIAPRVVLTAAHCIRPDAYAGASYVYFGNDYARDSAVLPDVPPPGSRTPFARIENWLVHPGYDAALNYPDLAVVYLDRELPVTPLPLRTARVGRSFIGDKATIVGYGASKIDDATGLPAGAGRKRAGTAKILGSPTAADFHEDDPNAGILDPAIRVDLLKLNGERPNAAICAGDSGGPLLLEEHGKTYVAGVSFWGGVGCEGYSMYTRIDPFVDFIKGAIADGGKRPVVPRLECVAKDDDGSYTAYFGYTNQNSLSIEVPYGKKNELKGDREGARPELFAYGDHAWAFSVDFAKNDKLSYKLSPPSGPTTVVNADRRSPACNPEDPYFVCAQACETILSAECADPSVAASRCIAECASFAQFFPSCTAEVNNYWRCVEGQSTAAENWYCDVDFVPQALGCQEEYFAALICGGAF